MKKGRNELVGAGVSSDGFPWLISALPPSFHRLSLFLLWSSHSLYCTRRTRLPLFFSVSCTVMHRCCHPSKMICHGSKLPSVGQNTLIHRGTVTAGPALSAVYRRTDEKTPCRGEESEFQRHRQSRGRKLMASRSFRFSPQNSRPWKGRMVDRGARFSRSCGLVLSLIFITVFVSVGVPLPPFSTPHQCLGHYTRTKMSYQGRCTSVSLLPSPDTRTSTSVGV